MLKNILMINFINSFDNSSSRKSLLQKKSCVVGHEKTCVTHYCACKQKHQTGKLNKNCRKRECQLIDARTTLVSYKKCIN